MEELYVEGVATHDGPEPCFAEELGEAPQPYERLLGDAVAGDSSL